VSYRVQYYLYIIKACAAAVFESFKKHTIGTGTQHPMWHW